MPFVLRVRGQTLRAWIGRTSGLLYGTALRCYSIYHTSDRDAGLHLRREITGMGLRIFRAPRLDPFNRLCSLRTLHSWQYSRCQRICFPISITFARASLARSFAVAVPTPGRRCAFSRYVNRAQVFLSISCMLSIFSYSLQAIIAYSHPSQRVSFSASASRIQSFSLLPCCPY